MKKTSRVSLLAPFGFVLLISMVLLSVFRAGFIVWQWERVSATDGLWFILCQGMRFDIIILSALLLLPLVLSPLLALSHRIYPTWQSFCRWYLCAVALFLLFMELATPNFLIQFDVRPNILFVEYLKYPKEVLSMLWGGFKLTIIIATIVVPVAAIGLWRTVPQVTQISIRWYQAIPMSAVLLIVCVLGARSSLGHRPINPSVIAFSTDLMVNDIAMNSAYSVLYAIYESTRDEAGKTHYGEMADSDMLSLVKENMFIDNNDFIEGDIPTLHRQTATLPLKRPKNIVIILEESLGAEYVGRLGGTPVTPNLDTLAEQGIWFENLYATGTRSVRGIEAIITGFTPTPARSVVKLNKSQRNFFTFAELLKRQGYDTSFLYGGEAHFDNMKRFFVNNGFNTIIDQKDFSNPAFVGSWGVSDEDLLNKAHETFEAYGDKPFFSLVFSSSNHAPFEFPDDRIELYDTEKATEANAVKYADYSVGEFFKKAKASNYWDNTLFLVVADHNTRVRGAELVPINYFHIPGLILGGGVEPKKYQRISSQIDLLPTLLSMAGITSKHPAIGHDLTRQEMVDIPGRAMMQYNATQAYIEEDKVVIFEKNKPAVQYSYLQGRLVKSEYQDSELLAKALAHSLFGPYSYTQGSYRLNDQP